MASEGLSQHDLGAVLAFLQAHETAADERSFAEGVMSGLRSLVRCDGISYNDIDMAAPAAQWLSDPGELAVAAEPRRETFERCMLQHPVIAAFSRSDDGTPRKLSDFIGQRRFARTELYRDFYEPLELEHQLVCHWSVSAHRFIGIGLFRTQGDFSERDRAILGLLRPYLAVGQRACRAQAHARRTLETFERTLGSSGQALVLLGDRNEVDLLLGHADCLLSTYFEPPGGALLPDELSRWVLAQRQRLNGERELPPVPSVFAKDGPCGRVTVQFLPAQSPGQPDALLLSERSLEAVPGERLAALGLTAREAQVLHHVAVGRTNEEIAQELFLSIRTVKKHLEHVYRKLDVKTRTAAVAKARAGGS